MGEFVVDGDADAMGGDAVSELDLVEELRFFADATDADGVMVTMLSGRTFADAADEIERLRSLVAVWDDAPLGDRETSDIVSRLRDAERYGQFGRSLLYRQVADEIERLRADVDYVHDSFATDASDSYAEIARLRSLIVAWCDADDDLEDVDGVYHSAWLALRKAVGR
jgi:hypothetical protein